VKVQKGISNVEFNVKELDSNKIISVIC